MRALDEALMNSKQVLASTRRCHEVKMRAKDVDAEGWTQITGSPEQGITDSDASSIDTPLRYEVPRGIQEAEGNITHPAGSHPVLEAPGRYREFALLICQEIGTEDVHQDGLKRLLRLETLDPIRFEHSVPSSVVETEDVHGRQ